MLHVCDLMLLYFRSHISIIVTCTSLILFNVKSFNFKQIDRKSHRTIENAPNLERTCFPINTWPRDQVRLKIAPNCATLDAQCHLKPRFNIVSAWLWTWLTLQEDTEMNCGLIALGVWEFETRPYHLHLHLPIRVVFYMLLPFYSRIDLTMPFLWEWLRSTNPQAENSQIERGGEKR